MVTNSACRSKPFQKEPTSVFWTDGHGIHLRALLARWFTNASREANARNTLGVDAVSLIGFAAASPRGARRSEGARKALR
jgi:hypothetical protein